MTIEDFGGKRALVTGAASGIGREIALQLAAPGARVLAADIDKDGLATLGRDGGDAVVGVPADVTEISGGCPGLQSGEESGAPPGGAACREADTPGTPPQLLRKNMRLCDSEDGVPVPGLSRRAAAGGAEPHLRLRPRGVEPDPGAAAGPLAS
jgi:hypothetical protein